MDSRQESSFGVVDMVIDSVRVEVDGGLKFSFLFFLFGVSECAGWSFCAL